MTRARPVVLHVLEALEGGTARHLCDVATYSTGAEHIVLVPERRVGGLTDETAHARLVTAGAAVDRLDMHRAPWAAANRRALKELRGRLRSIRPDVVHGHSSIGGLLARLATRGTGVPVVYTPNGITRVRAGLAVERRLRRLTSVFIATSESEARLAVQLRVAGPDQVRTIPNGIELELPPRSIDLRAFIDVPAGAPLVGTIARLVPQKAPEDLVAACAAVARRHPEARFVVIGGGELERRYEAAVDRAGLRSKLTRIESLPAAASVLDQLDVFVLASRFEGGPYAPLEAMRAGTAVVLTDVTGSHDVVEDGISGRLVPPGDPDALGAAVADLLDDPAQRERLAVAGRQRVADRFDVRTMGSALDEVYRQLRG